MMGSECMATFLVHNYCTATPCDARVYAAALIPRRQNQYVPSIVGSSPAPCCMLGSAHLPIPGLCQRCFVDLAAFYCVTVSLIQGRFWFRRGCALRSQYHSCYPVIDEKARNDLLVYWQPSLPSLCIHISIFNFVFRTGLDLISFQY